MSFLRQYKRTAYCGDINDRMVGNMVTVMGWVHSRRDHGSLIFLDLRDRSGLVQVVIDPQRPQFAEAHKIRPESVLGIHGRVEKRPQGMENPKISSGKVEIKVEVFEIFSEAQPLPFQLDDEQVNETTRLKYRYIDLRRPRMQDNLRLRHEVTRFVREFLSNHGFWEVETPILFKSTPEGARDYLVPSRVHPGNFYALPQSPQTLKQILMISGYDRYFQIARCFRDEDLRADRQPEFTQIDMEMSFVEQEDVMELNEKLLRALWRQFRGSEIGDVPRLSYQEAMDRFGSDKPDLRINNLEIIDVASCFSETQFHVFRDVLHRSGVVRALLIPGGAKQPRSFYDKLVDSAKALGASGLVWVKWETGKVTSSAAKFFADHELQQLQVRLGAKEGDGAIIMADSWLLVCQVLGALRLQVAHQLQLVDKTIDRFCWIVDFPLFEYSSEEKRWVACHHPFTSPKDEYVSILKSQQEAQYGQCLAKAYDLVCNGYELAGGSLRIYRADVQEAMFRALGLSEEDIKQKFGFFVEALKYGTPPHGGIAWGMDRLIMILTGAEAIREVIAFPKTAKAVDLMAECPSSVQVGQLIELGIRVVASSPKNDN
ncbi:MAG: aspartate--tRNA ligase [Bdellovibrionaceae bacterium]|nr:aspartate--tRNA ligase [Pseudobdellovibrionaceae bacterium]MDW8190580.1 aspartate--tRNA ligase [Pseudobdellovibrionaceae bacterium]